MYCDTRSGVPIWYFSPPADAEMRVPSYIADCAVFLGVKAVLKPGKIPFKGTGFWVALRNENTAITGHSYYLVTAAHVAEVLEAYSSTDVQGRREPHWYARMNVGGKAVEIRAGMKERWIYHHDATVDAAVCPLTPPADDFFQRVVDEDTFVSDWNMEHDYGVGDDVFMTGMFSPLTGEAQNFPIVRMGNLAMLPGSERIPVEKHTRRGYLVENMEGYLIEARSISGISGSPCFVRGTTQTKEPARYSGIAPPQHYQISDIGPRARELRELLAYTRDVDRKLEESLKSRPLGVDEEYRLLGLMHGHWDLPPEAKNDTADETVTAAAQDATAVEDAAADALADVVRRKTNAVNMGIAIVVPMRKILEILNRPELKSQRRAAAEAGRHSAVPDGE
jgi:hypothetical protein